MLPATTVRRNWVGLDCPAVLVLRHAIRFPPSAVPAPETPASIPPGLLELFMAFAKMSLAGFGGVLVWARAALSTSTAG